MVEVSSQAARRPRRAVLLVLPGLLLLAAFLSAGTFHLEDVTVGGVPVLGAPEALPAGHRLVEVGRSDPEIAVTFSGWAAAGVSLQVDGRPVEARVRWLGGRAEARPGPLADGVHRLEVRAGGVRRSCEFRVDTVPPRATVEAPASRTAADAVALRARAEPGCLLEVAFPGGSRSARADGGGRISLEVPLAQGPNPLRWRASDGAGNTVEGSLEVLSDRTPPAVRFLSPAPGGVARSNSPVLEMEAEDGETGLAGATLIPERGRPVKLAVKGKRLVHETSGLYEGRQAFTLEVRNGVGGVARERCEFLVDSTEKFGEAILAAGARGQDVEELQDRLRREGVLQEPDLPGSLGEPTRKALVAFQESLGLEPDGVAGPYTLGALGSRIYVNLARFSLVLEEPGGARHGYPIAHGMPEYPTPTGRFHVADKEKNPTWIPPDSVWAKEAKATPPGPGNPLGTRWIGLSNGVVGIHGTPAEWTVGSRASHGCIRMTVRDVEDLYERVGPGTRVVIFAGTEPDPDLERLWP